MVVVVFQGLDETRLCGDYMVVFKVIEEYLSINSFTCLLGYSFPSYSNSE